MRVSSSLRPSFVVGPPGCPIERKRQTILWQVDGGGHEVIDDAKTLQVGITIAKSAIQRDQRKELFEIPEHVG